MPRPVRSRRAAFSYIELLVSVGLVSVLLTLLMPVVGKTRASAQSVYCLSQLRQIAAGLTQYAADNDKRLPDPFMLQTSWEQLLRRYVTSPDAFHCPGDGEAPKRSSQVLHCETSWRRRSSVTKQGFKPVIHVLL